ncbi:hypothetical protein Mgra_00008512 [Meloidogyne graminicola]|uniref:Uncharacterized protein n=1 Tax=Meloidogyne graminicola TaxID=189291 RepID=A0A8S9ZFL5_9BILA|nr:hypothetical protein Mgra_00008512 [Meloidogyne graminicola]
MQNFELHFECREVEELAYKLIENEQEKSKFYPELKNTIAKIWSDPIVQKEIVPKGNEFNFNESCLYFFNALDRIFDPNYVPTIQDILMLRIITTGIIELKFEIKNVNFRVFDVGGQRSERKKWIHCFDDVHAIIFVVALSEFDQVLFEDNKTVGVFMNFFAGKQKYLNKISFKNRMIESLRLFRSICNSRWFYNTAMILFLNKKDLFTEKIKTTSIQCLFKNYIGPNTYEDQVKHIEEKFSALNSNPNKALYIHETCATDTNQIQLILENVIDVLLRKILHDYGLY